MRLDTFKIEPYDDDDDNGDDDDDDDVNDKTCLVPMLHSSLTNLLSKLSFPREPFITKVQLQHRNPTQATISVMVFLK